MNEQNNQQDNSNEAPPPALADLEAIDAGEIKGGPKAGAGALILLSSNATECKGDLTKVGVGSL